MKLHRSGTNMALAAAMLLAGGACAPSTGGPGGTAGSTGTAGQHGHRGEHGHRGQRWHSGQHGHCGQRGRNDRRRNGRHGRLRRCGRGRRGGRCGRWTRRHRGIDGGTRGRGGIDSGTRGRGGRGHGRDSRWRGQRKRMAMFKVQVQLASAVKSPHPGRSASSPGRDVPSAHVGAHRLRPHHELRHVRARRSRAEDHRTLLLGMKPAKTYHFRVVARDGSTPYTSNDQTVTTGASSLHGPSALPRELRGGRKPGFIVTSYWQGTGSSVAFILDRDGDIVWWGRGGLGDDGGISRARMSADGKTMWMVVSSNSGDPCGA